MISYRVGSWYRRTYLAMFPLLKFSMIRFSVLILFPCLVSGANLQWSDCTNNRNSPFSIHNINVQPQPIIMPGDVHLSIDARLSRSVGNSTFDVRIWMKTIFGEFRIPCVFSHFGSCVFPELCNLVNEMVSENWLGVSRSLGQELVQMLATQGVDPRVCPVQPMRLRLQNYRLRLPSVPTVILWFATGEYRAEIRIIEKRSGQEMVCVNAHVGVAKRCSGWFCGK